MSTPDAPKRPMGSKNKPDAGTKIVLRDSCTYLRVRMLAEPPHHTLRRFHPFIAPVPLSLPVRGLVTGNSASVDASHDEVDVQPIPPTARVPPSAGALVDQLLENGPDLDDEDERHDTEDDGGNDGEFQNDRDEEI